MKHVKLLILNILLISACSKDDTTLISLEEFLKEVENVCISATDAVKCPVPWNVDVAKTFIIPDSIIRSMSTCGLLETFLNIPIDVYLLARMTHQLYSPYITELNKAMEEDKVVVEFFKRDDCFSVLASKYQNLIKENSRTDKLEMFLLQSNICMSTLNKREKILLLDMSLNRYRECTENTEKRGVCHIMIAIMRSCNYFPFVKEIVPMLFECMSGYSFRITNDSSLITWGLTDDQIEIIVNYAKRFLKELKRKTS